MNSSPKFRFECFRHYASRYVWSLDCHSTHAHLCHSEVCWSDVCNLIERETLFTQYFSKSFNECALNEVRKELHNGHEIAVAPEIKTPQLHLHTTVDCFGVFGCVLRSFSYRHDEDILSARRSFRSYERVRRTNTRVLRKLHEHFFKWPLVRGTVKDAFPSK